MRLLRAMCAPLWLAACGTRGGALSELPSGAQSSAPSVVSTTQRSSGREGEAQLDSIISATRQPRAEIEYPELLLLLARLDRTDSGILRSRRLTLQRQILRAPGGAAASAQVFMAICGQLKDGDSAVATLQALPANAESAQVRLVILHHALGDLYYRQLYGEIVRNSDLIRDMILSYRRHPLPGRESADEAAALLYEALLAQNQLAQAQEISTRTTSDSPHAKTYLKMIAAAARLSKDDEVSRLRAEAIRSVPDSEKPELDGDAH